MNAVTVGPPELAGHETARLELTPAETEMLREQARALCEVADGELDSPGFLDAARDRSERLPLRMRQAVRRFRRDRGPAPGPGT